MPPHLLTNYEIQKYYQNEKSLMVFFLEKNCKKTAWKNKGWGLYNKPRWICRRSIDWIALFCSRNEIVCFDSFSVEHVPEEIKEFNWNKNMKANIFRIQANDSVMCGCFCIGFVNFMLAGKKLTDFRNLLSPYDFQKKLWHSSELF